MLTFRAWATCNINRTSFFTDLCRKAADLVRVYWNTRSHQIRDGNDYFCIAKQNRSFFKNDFNYFVCFIDSGHAEMKNSDSRYPYVKRKLKDFDSGPRYPYVKRKLRILTPALAILMLSASWRILTPAPAILILSVRWGILIPAWRTRNKAGKKD